MNSIKYTTRENPGEIQMMWLPSHLSISDLEYIARQFGIYIEHAWYVSQYSMK